MLLSLATLAAAASLFSQGVLAFDVKDIPADTPVSSLLSSAQSHLSRGETGEALVYYDAAIARDPSNYLTFFKRATTYLSIGRTSQATDDFNKVLTLKPGFEGAHVQLARLKSRTADWEGAREQYRLANKAPETPELVELEEAHGAANLAEDAVKQGDWDSCVNHLSKAISVASRSSHLRDLRARCRFEMGVLEEAMSDLQHVVHMKPGDTTPHIKISAITFYAMGDLESGMAQARKCLHSDPDSKVCKKLLRWQKNVEKALSKAAKALDSSRPMTAIKVLVDSEGETGLMTDIREHTKELREGTYIPDKAPDSLYTRAVEMTCQGYFDMNNKKAGQFCEEALKLNENSFYGLLYQGKQLHEKEDYEAAIRQFEKAAEVAEGKREEVVRSLLNKAKIELKRSRTKDYYKVLGVARDADERQIKSAYRKMSKQFHPDKAAILGVTKVEAEKKMAAINEAYEVLSNPELRARFDQGDDPNDPQGQSHPFQGNPFGGGAPFFFHQGGPGGGGGGAKFHFQFG